MKFTRFLFISLKQKLGISHIFLRIYFFIVQIAWPIWFALEGNFGKLSPNKEIEPGNESYLPWECYAMYSQPSTRHQSPHDHRIWKSMWRGGGPFPKHKQIHFSDMIKKRTQFIYMTYCKICSLIEYIYLCACNDNDNDFISSQNSSVFSWPYN